MPDSPAKNIVENSLIGYQVCICFELWIYKRSLILDSCYRLYTILRMLNDDTQLY